VVGYFGSKWSFSQFKIKDTDAKCAIIDQKIIAITTQGNYYMGDIAQQGEIKVEKWASLLEEQSEDQE